MNSPVCLVKPLEICYDKVKGQDYWSAHHCCAAVRATESSLLARLGHLDVGAREAAARRIATVREDERDRREGVAFFEAYVRGRGGPMMGRLPS